VTHRDASKKGWSASEAPNITEINMGSFQRIADAAELMAKNHQQLVSDLHYYKARYEEMSKRVEEENRSNAALRGVITKLKKAKAVAA
jgi:hypothetical protein